MMTTELDRDALYAQYRDKVRGYVRSKLRNPADVEDTVQTVFLKVYASLDRYDPEKASLSTWIYTVTRNTVYDLLRRQRDHPSIELSDDAADPADAPDAAILNDETLEELAAALERLPPAQRDVIILLYYKQMERKNAALLLGVTYGQLRYLHDKAIRRLGELLGAK